VVLTILVLVRFPLADCFDCEGPNPWGRDDVAYLLRLRLFMAWLTGSSILLGLYRVPFGWLAPLLIAMGDLLTEHIGGVAWWSLLNNEGPSILLFDIGFGMAGLALGTLIQVILRKIKCAPLA
jgi:hypothetical protein